MWRLEKGQIGLFVSICVACACHAYRASPCSRDRKTRPLPLSPVFLESTLSTLGLSEREANEFIIYWLPQMEQNPYNLVSFPIDEYSRHARLDITPRPDTIIRVFMVFKAVDRPCEIKPQQLLPVTRRGFTVVEWGGTEIR